MRPMARLEVLKPKRRMPGSSPRGTCWAKTQSRSALARLASMVRRTLSFASERTSTSAMGARTYHERSKDVAKEPLNEGAMPAPPAAGPSAA